MFPRHARSVTAALTLAAVTATLSACVSVQPFDPHGPNASTGAQPPSGGPSSDAPSSDRSGGDAGAAALVRRAAGNLRSVRTLTYKEVVVDGEDTSTVAVRGDVDGSPLEETDTSTQGGTAVALHIGTKEYVKGDAAYYAGTGAGAHAEFVDRWTVADVDASSGDDPDPGLQGVIDDISDESGYLETLYDDDATVERTTLDGTPAHEVSGYDGTTMWISADGRERIMRISGVEMDDGGQGTQHFSGYDETYDLRAPKNAIEVKYDDGSAPNV